MDGANGAKVGASFGVMAVSPTPALSVHCVGGRCPSTNAREIPVDRPALPL